MIHRYFFLFFIFCSLSLSGQSRKELIELGDAAFDNGNYNGAAYFFGKAVGSFESGENEVAYPYDLVPWIKPLKERPGSDTSAFDSSDTADKHKLTDTTTSKTIQKKHDELYAYALYRLAESSRLDHDYENAEKYYGAALEIDSSKYPLVRFYYASSLKKNKKYLQAIDEYEKFIHHFPGRSEKPDIGGIIRQAPVEIAGCRFAMKSIENPRKGILITEADTVINTGIAAFAPAFFEHDSSVVFASLLGGGSGDLYRTEKNETGWKKPVRIPQPVNSILNEGAVTFTSDHSQMIFTRCSGSGDKMECFLFTSRFLNGQWLQPMKLNENVNIPGYKTMHPALSPDDLTLYFASDRPGGYGQSDIWYCTIDEAGNTGPVTNTGEKINTPGNEISPFYHGKSKTLYFSSDGHPGMGGYDIFEAEGEENKWFEPDNPGNPVNSHRDDLYFIAAENTRMAYFTSDRSDCGECPQKNCYRIFEVSYEPLRIYVNGYVYNKANKEVIPNALVTLNDMDENLEPFFVITDENGFYTTPLRRNMAYGMKAQKVRHFADTASVTTFGFDATATLRRDFYLERIPVGEIKIEGIYYDYDKWNIRSESEETLKKLKKFLLINNNIVIELSSHTDSRGNDDYNMELSRKRAQSVVDWLVTNGIDYERMKPVGYGESRPVVKNAQTEEDHQLNRRTSFEVLSEDFVPGKKWK